MKHTARRTRKGKELAINGKGKTLNDIRSEALSKEQMKKERGSLRNTMARKLGK